ILPSSAPAGAPSIVRVAAPLWRPRQLAGGEVPSQKAQPSGARRRRGRPADTDEKQDKRIWDAWQSKAHKTYRELASALKIPTMQVKAAIERQRKRMERRGGAPDKPGQGH